MRHMRKLLLGAAGAGALLAAGCLAAAAAGAVGAVYVTKRGAESLVTTSVSKTYDATRQAFQDMGISETKNSRDVNGSTEKRSLEGKSNDLEIEVGLKTQGSGPHVEVVAKKSRVTWDKDYAKQLLAKIVEKTK